MRRPVIRTEYPYGKAVFAEEVRLGGVPEAEADGDGLFDLLAPDHYGIAFDAGLGGKELLVAAGNVEFRGRPAPAYQAVFRVGEVNPYWSFSACIRW
jgi:hypothetical protein